MRVFKPVSHVAKRLLQTPIHIYRLVISPLIGPSCRFQPTCSSYALEAIEKHGPLKGIALTARRLSRCHPIAWLGGSEGYDPVPEKSHTHKLPGTNQ
jgi:putative membrane protein insertion efficiency factor